MGPLSEEGVAPDDDAAAEAAAFGDSAEWVDWQSMKAQMGHDEL